MALGMAALILAGNMVACSPQEEASSLSSQTPVEDTGISLENDGSPTELVIAEIYQSQERTQALEEIAQKYEADFPQTSIEVVTVDSGEEALTLLEQGGADLCELSQDQQPSAVRQDLLLDLAPWLEYWEEASTLSGGAKRVLTSLGGEENYLMPATTEQDLFYYRKDWFSQYNEGKTEDLAYYNVWSLLPDAAQKLQDQGAAGFVCGGRDKLVDLFDDILWSSAGLGAMINPAGSYFCAYEGHDTLFSLEQAGTALEQFTQLVEEAMPEDALTWTEDQAVEAFLEGKAATLLASQSQMEKIAASMDEDSWAVSGVPMGSAGVAISGLGFTGFGVASATEHPGNAVHFLTFLSNSDNNTHLAKVSGQVPIHTNAWDLEPSFASEGGLLAIHQTIDRRTDLYAFALEPHMYQAFAEYRGLADDVLREYLSGKMNQEDTLDTLDSFWVQALEEEGPFWKTASQKEGS